MGWFGSLGLAWKYFVVFACLLVATILAGVFKILYNRKKLNKHIASKAERGREEADQVALNDRSRDEGDLFGVRALEAGYYGGVAQSRPSSPSPVSHPRNDSVSTGNTLVGSTTSPKLISPATSVTHLPHTRNPSADVLREHSRTPSMDVLRENVRKASSTNVLREHARKASTDVLRDHARNFSADTQPSSPPRRNPRSTLKLEPSQAELNGRRNHGAVDMALVVPASPVRNKSPMAPQSPTSPTDSESSHDEIPRSPAIMVSDASDFDGPRSPELLKPVAYQPNAPQLPVVESVSRISWRPEGDDATMNIRSMAASLDYTQGAITPEHSHSPSPKTPSPLPSPVKVSPQPYIPRRSRDEPRSIFPATRSSDERPRSRKGSFSSQKIRFTTYNDYSDIPSVPSVPTSAEDTDYILQPMVYVPTHGREASVSESNYSTDIRRMSSRRSSISSVETLTMEYLHADTSGLSRNGSTASRRHSIGSSLVPPSPNPSTTRFSEFYDAYYRHSQQSINVQPQIIEVARAETLAIPRHSTIVEVPTPLATPLASSMPDKHRFSMRSTEPGTAL